MMPTSFRYGVSTFLRLESCGYTQIAELNLVERLVKRDDDDDDNNKSINYYLRSDSTAMRQISETAHGREKRTITKTNFKQQSPS
jgi:hypothetical protein